MHVLIIDLIYRPTNLIMVLIYRSIGIDTVIDNGTVYNVIHVHVDVINAPIDNVINIQVNRI